MKRVLKKFRYGAKGFTLIELLIVVAILGVLVAVSMPNLIAFYGAGDTEARAVERDVVQAAVLAAMGDQSVTSITGGPLNSGADLTIGTTSVGAFIINTHTSLAYSYIIANTGVVTSQN